jgi:5'-3' exonuclease
MNSKPILILDCQYLCHRAFHALGANLDFAGEPTAVVFGFLKDVSALLNEFQTERVVFTWDRGCGKRREIYPEYKAVRMAAHQDATDEEKQARRDFLRQVQKLRECYVPQLGYRNSFWQDGYEADDVIASVVKQSLGEDDQAIIVSSDQDLWQLIGPNASCYNPYKKTLLDRDTFMATYGIEPCLWANVKALAGCSTDGVPGIKGIGEATAVKWFRSQLKFDSVAYRKINEMGIEIHNRNIQLVRLPFAGTEVFRLREDETSAERWRTLADKLGMKSIRELAPGMPRGVAGRGAVVQQKVKSAVGFGF